MAVADYQAARAIIAKRFKTQWDTTHPEVDGSRDVPVVWPNVQFNPKTDYLPASMTGWVTFSVLASGAFAASTSGAKVRQRTVGIIEVQVFVPQGTGDQMATTIADDAVSALQFVTLGGVVIGAATPVEIGETAEGWYQMNVSAEFRFDTLKSISDEHAYGTWQNPEILGGAGGLYIWYDSTGGNERHKAGSAPTFATDGEIAGVGDIV